MSHIAKIFMLSLIVVTTLIAGCSQQQAILAKGQPVPAFDLPNLAGHPVSLPDDFTDKVILIGFWADWCPSCKKELRDFETIYRKHQKQGLAVVAINIEQDAQTASAFIQGLNLSYNVVLDKKGDIAKKYSVTSLPSALIVDRQGKLNTRYLGETPARFFEQLVVSLL